MSNLFPRYGFNDSVRARADDGFSINDLAFTVYDEESKRITARAIRETNADVICLRGVESGLLPVSWTPP